MRALKANDIPLEERPHANDPTVPPQSISDMRLAMLGSLADGLAHELNSPLQILTDGYELLIEMNQTLVELLEQAGAASNLQGGELEDFQFLQSQVKPAEHRVKAGLSRVRDVVDTVQLFAGKANGRAKEKLEVLPAIRRALEPFLESPVEIRVSVRGEPVLSAAQEDFNTVIRELVDNAIEATLKNTDVPAGPVVVRGEHVDNRLVLEVSDQGVGMPSALQARIFEPYFSSHPDGKHRGRGLSIVEQLVRTKYRGVIIAHSTLNEGTTMRVEFPTDA